MLEQVEERAELHDDKHIMEPQAAGVSLTGQTGRGSMTAIPTHDLAHTTKSLNLTPPNVQVTIGTDVTPQTFDGVLINLAQTVPTFFSRFERTLEIVDDCDAARAQSRDRYRFYQKRGYPLQHHTLGN